MRDNKPLELEALRYIESKVARYGYEYEEMNYDRNGGDFFIVEDDGEETNAVLRCQSKGRSIYPHASSVEIDKSFIRNNFLVFVYLKPDNPDNVATYLFTAEDIKNGWREYDDYYSLYLPKGFISNENNDKYLFTFERSRIIRPLLDKCVHTFNRVTINALSASEFYFLIWQRTGSLPSIGFLRELVDRDEEFGYVGLPKSVFLLCAFVIQNHDGDVLLSIDWSFAFLKMMAFESCDEDKYVIGETFYTDAAVTYPCTWVKELLSKESRALLGYHLHMGNNEEHVDAYVWRSM